MNFPKDWYAVHLAKKASYIALAKEKHLIFFLTCPLQVERISLHLDGCENQKLRSIDLGFNGLIPLLGLAIVGNDKDLKQLTIWTRKNRSILTELLDL